MRLFHSVLLLSHHLSRQPSGGAPRYSCPTIAIGFTSVSSREWTPLTALLLGPKSVPSLGHFSVTVAQLYRARKLFPKLGLMEE